MLTLRQIINDHYRSYLLLLLTAYILAFFIPWDISIQTAPLPLILTQQVFPIIGVIIIIFSFMTRKVGLFMTGLLYLLAFWIYMSMIFSVLPGLFGN